MWYENLLRKEQAKLNTINDNCTCNSESYYWKSREYRTLTLHGHFLLFSRFHDLHTRGICQTRNADWLSHSDTNNEMGCGTCCGEMQKDK